MAKHGEITTRSLLHANKFVGFRAFNNGTQSINNTTQTKVTFGTEVYDTDSLFATSTFTVPSGLAGYWRLTAKVYFVAGGNAGTRACWFRQNGVTEVTGSSVGTDTNDDTRVLTTVTLNLSATNTIDVYCFQNSGGALNVGGATGENSNAFEAVYLGPA